MSFGKSGGSSKSEPEVWEGVEPYITGGDRRNPGPIDRFRPMEVNPQWSDWNQAVGQGFFVGPPPPMGMKDGVPGYHNIGGETWEDNMRPPEPQQGVSFGSGIDPWWFTQSGQDWMNNRLGVYDDTNQSYKRLKEQGVWDFSKTGSDALSYR